jgi:hypothetical protein
MSNLLKMATVHLIENLHRRGWSQRRIALNWASVARLSHDTSGWLRQPQNRPMRPSALEVPEMVGIRARFLRLRAGDPCLIAARWTPLASSLFPLRKKKEKASCGRSVDQVDNSGKVI